MVVGGGGHKPQCRVYVSCLGRPRVISRAKGLCVRIPGVVEPVPKLAEVYLMHCDFSILQTDHTSA